MKKVIIKQNYSDGIEKTVGKVREIIDNYHYYRDDNSRTIIFDKIWYYFKPSTTNMILYYDKAHDYDYNNQNELICIYPISFTSFVILVKKDDKINTIFKVYNIIEDCNCIIEKYVIKDDTIFEFPGIKVDNGYYISNCLYSDLLLRTEFNEVKVADEISDMTGYDFRYPVDKLKSNWTLYSSYADDRFGGFKDKDRFETYSHLIKNGDSYIFSNSDDSFYIVKVNEKNKITRIVYIERSFYKMDKTMVNYYELEKYTVFKYKIIDYRINSFDRFYVDKYDYIDPDTSYLNGFFVDTFNNAIMNTKRDNKLEQNTFDLIKFINSRNRYPDFSYPPLLGKKDFLALLVIIIGIILLLVLI